MIIDPSAFRQFEHKGWQEIASRYDRGFAWVTMESVTAYRLLRPGGRVAFTVWDTPEKAIGFGIVLSAIQKYGDLNVAIPPGPPFFRFSDDEEARRALSAAGFVNIAVTRIPQIWHLPSPETLFDVMYNGSVRNAALLRAQKPDALEAVRLAIRQAVIEYGNTLPMPAVLAAGERH